ncbi:SRPBCC family protein [Roseicyclus sp.]|uniref:SRPBCC family protein n=1 Tax=Roseicyclus sp. TaxID=1914329 RepID=UPI003F6B203E
MKFKVSEDVDAPQEMVWQRFTDFSGFEEDARGRGAVLNRVGNWTQTSQGVEWRGEVTVRGKSRPITAKVTQLVPQELCIVDSRIGGMNCHQEIIFVPLSATVTRVALMLDLSADTLTARLLLQTMKLARGRVLQKLQGVLARQGNAVEAAYRRQNRS